MKKQPSYALYQTIGPMREVDWRWRRAWSLFRAGKYFSPRLDDVETARALRFIRAQFGTMTPWYKRKLLRNLADVEAALEIHGGPPQTRLEVEARILGRQSAGEIARRAGLSAEAVVTYESLFFHVTDRLSAATFVSMQVIGLAPLMVAGTPNYAALTKMVAYNAGPVALEELLRYQTHKSAGNNAPRLAPRDRLLFDSIELFIQAQTLELDPATTADLLKKWPIVQPILQKAPRDRTLSDEFFRQTQLALENLAAEAGGSAQKVETGDAAEERAWVAA